MSKIVSAALTHRKFWIITLFGMFTIPIAFKIIFYEGGGDEIAFLMWPFALAALIKYRNNLRHALIAALFIYLYSIVLFLVYGVVFGKLGYGPIALLFFTPAFIVFAVITPLIAKASYGDKLARILISTGVVLGFMGAIGNKIWSWYSRYQGTIYANTRPFPSLETLFLNMNNYIYAFIGAVLGYLVFVIIRKYLKNGAD